MARRDDELGRVIGIGRAEGVGVAGNAGVNLAFGRLHRELDDGALGNAGLLDRLGRGAMRGADDEVAIVGRGRDGTIGQLSRGDVTGSAGVARRVGRTRWARGCYSLRRRSSGSGNLGDRRRCPRNQADEER